MKNNFCVSIFAWQLSLISSTTQVPKKSWKNCEKQILKTPSQLKFLDILSIYHVCISPIKLITKYCIHIFCIHFSVVLETVNPKK